MADLQFIQHIELIAHEWRLMVATPAGWLKKNLAVQLGSEILKGPGFSSPSRWQFSKVMVDGVCDSPENLHVLGSRNEELAIFFNVAFTYTYKPSFHFFNVAFTSIYLKKKL